jgi:hypothetical protein
MTMGESAKFLANSPYIRDLATVVIGYGMAINIVEVTWKSKLKSAFPDPNSYSMFMGNFSTMTGIVTLLMMLAGRVVFKQFGWGVAALITPITLLTTGIAFFSLTLFPAFFAPITAKLGTTPLMLAVMIGAIQNILSKGNAVIIIMIHHYHHHHHHHTQYHYHHYHHHHHHHYHYNLFYFTDIIDIITHRHYHHIYHITSHQLSSRFSTPASCLSSALSILSSSSFNSTINRCQVFSLRSLQRNGVYSIRRRIENQRCAYNSCFQAINTILIIGR